MFCVPLILNTKFVCIFNGLMRRYIKIEGCHILSRSSVCSPVQVKRLCYSKMQAFPHLSELPTVLGLSTQFLPTVVNVKLRKKIIVP